MISDDIDHNPDIHVVSSFNESLETVLTTEMIINFIPVSSPVAVESIVSVVDDWRDPDCVKSQVLNILQI